MSVPLLDANVLIALTLTDHVHHERASRWFVGIGRAAVCPIVQGALVRYFVRVGVPARSVRAVLVALHDDPRIEFWPDDLSYADLNVDDIRGHRQVTDAYLAGLAVQHGSRLATLDAALSATLPDRTLMIPEVS